MLTRRRNPVSWCARLAILFLITDCLIPGQALSTSNKGVQVTEKDLQKVGMQGPQASAIILRGLSEANRIFNADQSSSYQTTLKIILGPLLSRFGLQREILSTPVSTGGDEASGSIPSHAQISIQLNNRSTAGTSRASAANTWHRAIPLPKSGNDDLDSLVASWLVVAITLLTFFAIYLVVILIMVILKILGIVHDIGPHPFYILPMLIFYTICSILMGVLTLGIAFGMLLYVGVRDGDTSETIGSLMQTVHVAASNATIQSIAVLENVDAQVAEAENTTFPNMMAKLRTFNMTYNDSTTLDERISAASTAAIEMQNASRKLKETALKIDDKTQKAAGMVPQVMPTFRPN